MENGLASFEEKAERNLLIMCKEKEKLQKKAHELKRKLLLTQRKRELADVLDAQVSGHVVPTLHVPGRGEPGRVIRGSVAGGCPCRLALTLWPAFGTTGCWYGTGSCVLGLLPSCLQIEMLSPYEAVAERFKEQYKTFATALDTTRHELPVKSVHLDGDGQRFLGRKRDGCRARGRASERPVWVGACCVPATFIPLCHVTASSQIGVCPSSDGRGREWRGLARLRFVQGCTLSKDQAGI